MCVKMIGSFVQEGIMDWFTFLPETSNTPDKDIEAVLFKTLDIRQWMALLLWGRNNQGETYNLRADRLWCREGDPKKSMAPSLIEEELLRAVRGPSVWRSPAEHQRRKLYLERTPQTWSPDWCMHVRKTAWGQEKKHLRDLREQCPALTPGQE